MTVQELQEFFYLGKLIKHEQERLDVLRCSLDLKSPALTDMPKGSGTKDKIGDIVPEIVDQVAEIEKELQNYKAKRDRLQEYIDGIPFARVKLIMILRYVQQKSWRDVAEAIGGKETEYSVRNACYTYLREH